MKKVLLINGHQRYEGFAEGKLSKTLTDKAAEMMKSYGYEVRSTVVEHGYDIEEELEKHQWADVVFVQTPTYWMSVPYLFKKYIDEVYTTGLIQGVVANDDGHLLPASPDVEDLGRDPNHRRRGLVFLNK